MRINQTQKKATLLTGLSIVNYALIDQLEVDFSNGMSIITGETGAGKSILLGGLALVLGKRAESGVLRDQEKKCVIEARFSIHDYQLKALFEDLDLDYDAITIIRRELLPSGKSRAFVNDTPVTLDALQQLGDQLIDVHAQHQTLALTQTQFQLEVLDALAKNVELLADYKTTLKQYKEADRIHKQLINQKESLQQEFDYNRFLMEELEAAQLTPDMLSQLEEEQEQLANIEQIEEQLTAAKLRIEEEQYGVAIQLVEIKAALQKLNTFGKPYEELSKRLESVKIELEDMLQEIEHRIDLLEHKPERLQIVQEQLQKVYDLQHKHNVQTIPELMAIHKTLAEKVLSTEQIDEDVERLAAEKERLYNALSEKAEQLSTRRKEVLPQLINQLQRLLTALGMPNARFKGEFTPTSSFLPHGREEFEFGFSANAGSSFGSLKKVASGGELSRIMLSIKAILSQYKALPTIIFDEIDTGVSGEVAVKISEIMKDMGQYMQVISITHLPQVAAKGGHHFKVFKTIQDNQTSTQMKKLSPQERIVEIAGMLGGEEQSATAIEHAKELLN